MPVLVPITSSVKQIFTTQLGSWSVTFYFYYNERSERWIFDMYDATTGLALMLGQPFVLGQDFFEPYAWGIGTAFAFDTTARGAEAGPDDLGVRVLMPYLAPDEMAALFPVSTATRVVVTETLPPPIVLPPVVATPIFGGVGVAGGAGPVTVSGSGVILSNGVVLSQLQTNAETVGQSWSFTVNDQCVYLLLMGALRVFSDAATGMLYAMNAPIPVSVDGTGMYLYVSVNQLFGTSRPKIAS